MVSRPQPTHEPTPPEWIAEFEAAARRPLEQRFKYAFIKTYKPALDGRSTGLSRRWPSTAVGARRTCRSGSGMGAFEYRQAQEMRDAFAREGVRYLFLGKSGAILLGYPDTTEDADIFPLKNTDNGRALDLDLVFAPDGIEGFGLAFKRRIEADGFPVCHPDDIIASEQAAGRAKDRESLPRLRAFAAWWLNNRTN